MSKNFWRGFYDGFWMLRWPIVIAWVLIVGNAIYQGWVK